ncbi:hypothetical protein I8751_06285 [Nostocaceae cyanobacterium CENA357]|uniref:Uncharacterized protein n=1 Tax=Atlanticothrix silvestris CENA357 TaxID=1725252 RepID=A0A8J7HFJ8_9CYAN|nr:hypothetical protein [Atlanticothrix silvestris]MBH8551989.1 hypothetical protein [Atlanticothrix silvestris CENA357]
MKSSVYRNAAITTCVLGLLGLLVGCLGMSVSFEPTNPDISLPVSDNTTQAEANPASDVASQTGISASATNPPTNQVELNTNKTNPVLASRQGSAVNTKHQGTLRMSNQTDQPVRLALLARQSKVKSSAEKKINYDVPAHWDFAPSEGSNKGLILSLPNGNLKLETGDILVAFAQDGSRRYWGPFVVGETSLPTWNSQNQEWQLVLSQ